METFKVNDCLVVFKIKQANLSSIFDNANALLRRDANTHEHKLTNWNLLKLDSSTGYECRILGSVIPGTSNIQFKFCLIPTDYQYPPGGTGRASDPYLLSSFEGRGRGLPSHGYANSYSGLTKHHQHEAIWISLNGGDNIFFNKNCSSATWSCETSMSKEDMGDSVTFLIWIKSQKKISSGEEKALNQLSEMYEQQINCDVHFHFQDKNNQIGAHISILSMRSPVFSAMFQNYMMKEAKTRKVDIQDIQMNIFKELLNYIYSGRTSTPFTEATALDLFVAADKYDISDLKDECVFFLQLCIRIDNAIKLMVWAQLHSAQELIESTLEFTANHAKKICEMEDWENLTAKFPVLCVLATRRIVENVPDADSE